ncbi:MAG: hypothetical protein NZ473_00625 [Candidatus Kapabacteria bacterium]|nr:hypothetical protein [Candidatus Kapabacteria bacterium]MCS7170047.1 hypothetical protein [Candidatus Kapabacteria bacterium]MDW7996972.1 hypothetical protein [Bacteroidota bacterium]MDW8225046.1 hypothetical protein [Bacteroidota bacterium]
MPPGTPRTALLLLAPVAYAAITLITAPWWTVDDAYILFRYARHWVTTGIPVWNPGEPAVEGYTGTLYLALLAAGHGATALPLEALAKAIGLGAYTATALVLWLLLRDLHIRTSLRIGALALYFTAAFLFTHALSGLETMLFVALLTTAVWLSVRVVSSKFQGFPTIVSLVGILLLLSLVRPEGMLFACALIAGILLRPSVHKKRYFPFRFALRLELPRSFVLAFPTIFLLPLGIVTLWRWHLYGDLLPNTYYAKQANGLGLAALFSFLEFAAQYWAIPAAIAVVLSVVEWEAMVQRLRQYFRQYTPLGMSLGGATLILLAEYSRSTLQMNYAHRFWAMLYPLGLCLAAVLMEHGLRTTEVTASVRPLRFRRLKQITLGLLALQLAVHVGLWRWQERKFLRDYHRLLNEEHAAAAEFLQRLLPQDAWIVVYPDAGLIPYRTALPTIDGGRLSDRFLARHQWSGSAQDSSILSYFFARQPAAFIFKSRRDDRLRLNAEAEALIDDPRFAPYLLAASFRTQARRFSESYFLLVFVHQRFLKQISRLMPTTLSVANPGVLLRVDPL